MWLRVFIHMLRRTHVAVASVILAALDFVQSGVGEVDFFRAVVYGQAVGSFYVTANNGEHVGSIQRRSHDAGSLLVPVGPEHETVVGANGREE